MAVRKKLIRTISASHSPVVGLEKAMDKDAEEELGDVSATMRAEEEQLREISRKEEAERDVKMEKARQEDLKGPPDVLDKKFKALEYLLNQSKVGYMVTSSLARDENSRVISSCTPQSCYHRCRNKKRWTT